jgi:hypothetical protein
VITFSRSSRSRCGDPGDHVDPIPAITMRRCKHHASWVNQVEIFFSVLQRRVLRHEAYDSVGDLKTAVLGFLRHWNRHEKHPFRWTFKGYPLQTGRKVA